MSLPWAGHGTLGAGGRLLEYACHGPAPAHAPTLVLLHEGLGCVALWRDVPVALAGATGFGVFVFSRAGYGQSDPADLPRPVDYMTQEAVTVLPEVLDAAGIGRCVLVGHSDGATIAAIHAGTVADARIRGLVLIAPHFFTEPVGLSEIARARDAFDSGDLRARLARYHRDPVTTFRGWNDIWLHPEFRAWTVEDVIEHIRVPVLAIQGAEDQYGTLAQIEVLETRCAAPVERLILPACRHAPHLEAGQAVVDAIAGFCRRLDRIEAADVRQPGGA